MSKIIVLGEALIDLFAETGVSLHEARNLHPSPGGAPANVAVALARLGADVGFIGKVGVDDYGTFLIERMSSEGVNTTHLVADPYGPTMLAIVATPSATEQQFILYNGANTLLSATELPRVSIERAKLFVYGSVTLAAQSKGAALQAARWSIEAGRQVIFDVNLRPLIWPDLTVARQAIDEALTVATIVKLNETELEFLTGTTDPIQGSQTLLERGLQLCCVSLGEAGAYFNNGTAQGHVPACSVDVKDTTGSGDAFVAGLAYQLANQTMAVATLDEGTLQEIATFANACGALAATAVGAMGALPRLAQVQEWC